MAQHEGFVPVGDAGDGIPTIGVGMLGHGFMGRAHANALKTAPYMYWPPAARPRLVAICGRDADRAAEAARRYGFEGYYTDWRAMLADDRIQLFDNVGPDSTHVEPTIAALAAGKHVLCEKPLALDAADALRMLRAARAAGTKSLCGFNYRFMPPVRLARDLLDRGLLGQIYEYRGTYLQGGMADPDAPLRKAPPPGSRATGSLSNIGSHVFDQVRFLLGEIATVSATMRTFVRERPHPAGGRVAVDSDDAFAAVVELASGAIGTVEATRVAAGRKNRLGWEINGARGSLAFDLERPSELRVYLADGATPEAVGFQDVSVTEAGHPFAQAWWPRGHVIGWEHAHINEMNHLLECIARDTPVGPYGATFEDGYRNAVICDAVTESAQRGVRVAIQYEA